MNIDQINSLVPGRAYRVQIRSSKMDHRGRVTHTLGRRMVRRFFGTNLRFGGIHCAVFSSALTRGKSSAQEVSVPHYDLIQADEHRTA